MLIGDLRVKTTSRRRQAPGVGAPQTPDLRKDGTSVSAKHYSAILSAALLAVVVLAAYQPEAEAIANAKFGPRLAASCYYSHSSEEDPIIHPMPGMGHAHRFYGNESTNQTSTNASLREGTDLCKQQGDKSAIWTPEASWNGVPVYAGRAVVYYQVTRGIPQGKINALPPWFKAIDRDPTFSCGIKGEFQRFAPGECGAGYFRVRFEFQQCLDPTNQSAEENLSSPVRGKKGLHCPAKYPRLIPRIQVTFGYPLPKDVTEGPFRVDSSNGMVRALNDHADYMGAWVGDTQQALVRTCLRTVDFKERRPATCRTADGK